MPNPKRKHSKRRTAIRRANDFLKPKGNSTCPQCGTDTRLPHRVCPECGYYRGEERIEAESE